MVSSARQTIVCIFFLLSAAMCLQSQTAPAKVSTASISGKITLKGKGLGGIVVGLVRAESGRQEGTVYQGVSDEQGTYHINNVQPGTYQVAPSAPAYVMKNEIGPIKSLIVNKDEAIENMDFELTRGGVITGRVTDTDGRALIEEEVVISQVQGNRQFTYRSYGGRTDDRGVYRIFGLSAGNYIVSVGQGDENLGASFGQTAYRRTFHPAASDISQATTIEVAEGSESANVDITVGRALSKYTASGQIVDGETGRPVPNVRYELQMFYGRGGGGSISTGAVTNQAGEFRFDNLSPGRYAVGVEQTSNSDLRAEDAPFEIKDQDVTGLVVKTEKGASVSGIVVVEGRDAKDLQTKLGRTLVYAWVEKSEKSGPSRNTNRSAQVNRDGTFRIAGLQSGLARVMIHNEDQFQMARMEHERVVQNNSIELKDGESVNGVRIVLAYAGGSISGVVKLENGPLPQGVYVYISLRMIRDNTDPTADRSEMSAQPDARGQFVFKPLLPGTYEVSAIRYDPGSRNQMPRVRQQVVVTNGPAASVTLTFEPSPERP